MRSIKYLFTCVMVMCIAATSHANNLQITGLSVNQNSTTGGTVSFTLGWNNCWNLSTSVAPNNWDAAWVFVKWRLCTASPAVAFTHGTLSTTMSNHTIPSSYQAMTSLPQASYYSASGSTVINSSSGTLDDANGIMLVPTTIGTQTSVTGAVTLYVSNLPASSNAVTVEVVGIEMVYVPQGPFNLGDGSTNGSNYHFCVSASSANPASVSSTNESGTSSYFYMSGGTTTPATYATNVPAAWPKGYYAFYCMKHEITEDLYSQFLNTIGSSAAQNRWPGNSGTNRNALVQNSSSSFSTTRPYRAQNWLSWADWEAVLDWSALRPMTELEFEKACRGGSSSVANGAMNNEYPWQSTTISQGTVLSGTENGTETVTNGGNCMYGISTCCTPISNGDGGYGPVRAGIYATSSSGQQSAGATYYGILDMGGNVREYVVQMTTNVSGDTMQRNVGDGTLQATAGTFGGGTLAIGDANVPLWPQPNGTQQTSSPYVGTQCFGTRGGDFYGSASYVQTSDRYGCYSSNTSTPTSNLSTARALNSGGRGVR